MLKMDDEAGLRPESCHLLEIYALGGSAPVALNRSRRFASPSPADPIIQGRFDLDDS